MRYCVHLGARTWAAQQRKRACACPSWWELELYNVFLAMYIAIIDKEEYRGL